MKIQATIVLFASAWTAAPVLAADANAGKNVFRVQCALCHSAEPTDNGGAQGPGLEGLFGRKAAGNSSYSYTDALKNSNLTWDDATLDRFLASPTTVVPGSAMVVAMPNKEERENIVAYFAALKDGTFREAPPVTRGPPPAPPATANAGPPKGEADWKNDKPGRVHRIDVANLKAPFDTPTVRNAPKLIEKPANAALSVPPDSASIRSQPVCAGLARCGWPRTAIFSSRRCRPGASAYCGLLRTAAPPQRHPYLHRA